MLLVALQKLLAQVLEAVSLRGHGEGTGDHGAGAAGDLVANQVLGHRW